MNDTGIIKIYYWPDGSWVYEQELDNIERPKRASWFTVRDNTTDEQIQEDVRLLLRNRK